MKYYVRIYCRMRTDPVITALTDELHRFWVNILQFGGDEDKHGKVGSTEFIAHAFQFTKTRTEKLLKGLSKSNLVILKEGEWWIRNWNRYQSKPSDLAEATRIRKQQQREREKGAGHAPEARDGHANTGVTEEGPENVTPLKNNKALVVNDSTEKGLISSEESTTRTNSTGVTKEIISMLSEIGWVGGFEEVEAALAKPGGEDRVRGLLRMALKAPPEFAAARFRINLRNGINPPIDPDSPEGRRRYLQPLEDQGIILES